jgi:hypothetical protein
MLKISDAVRSELLNSDNALESLSQGILNLSAYAKSIHRNIEKATMKPVKLGTIVAALARLSTDMQKLPLVCAPVSLQDIAVKSGLCEIAFEQSESNRENLRKLYGSKRFRATDFLTATYGVGELSIVANEKHKQLILDIFAHQKPKLVAEKLSALTMRFSEHYMHTPGQTFWLVRKIAIERLNIIEIVSTFTELTFLLHEKDMNKAFSVFAPLLKTSD